jgi:hypothetical protein
MSKQIADALAKLVGDKNAPAEVDVENYKTRPASVQTRGLNGAPPDPKYGIVSPLTEQSRTEVEVVVTVPAGTTSVTFSIASQIIMTDASGTEFVFNYAVPES